MSKDIKELVLGSKKYYVKTQNQTKTFGICVKIKTFQYVYSTVCGECQDIWSEKHLSKSCSTRCLDAIRKEIECHWTVKIRSVFMIKLKTQNYDSAGILIAACYYDFFNLWQVITSVCLHMLIVKLGNWCYLFYRIIWRLKWVNIWCSKKSPARRQC